MQKNQSVAAIVDKQLQTSPQKENDTLRPDNDRLMLSKPEPMLHPSASSDHLMPTALTIAFDIVDTISTLYLRTRAFALQHPYLLPVCARATFSLFSSSENLDS